MGLNKIIGWTGAMITAILFTIIIINSMYVSKLNELRWCVQIMFVSMAMNKSREITRVTWHLLVEGFLSSNRNSNNSSSSKGSNSVNKKSQCKSGNSNRKPYLLVQIHRGNKCIIFFPICIWWPMHKSRSYGSPNTNDGQIYCVLYSTWSMEN